jgi:putative glutamine amidotransferase
MTKWSKQPLIGITTYGRHEPIPFSLPGVYIDAVRAAGGIPVLLPPGEVEPSLLLEPLDGLIIPGGGDIHPRWYKGADHNSIYCTDLERDDFELRLARYVLANHVPVLGICRGLQILIVASGGTLIPHVPDEYNGVHRLDPEPGQRHPTEHQVQITHSESCLAKITKRSVFPVVSWHHQAVRELPSDWQVVAHSIEDRLIEAVEHRIHPWAIGVQWHPELSQNIREHQRIFQVFVETAKTRSLSSGICVQKNQGTFSSKERVA